MIVLDEHRFFATFLGDQSVPADDLVWESTSNQQMIGDESRDEQSLVGNLKEPAINVWDELRTLFGLLSWGRKQSPVGNFNLTRGESQQAYAKS